MLINGSSFSYFIIILYNLNEFFITSRAFSRIQHHYSSWITFRPPPPVLPPTGINTKQQPGKTNKHQPNTHFAFFIRTPALCVKWTITPRGTLDYSELALSWLSRLRGAPSYRIFRFCINFHSDVSSERLIS